jgi:hypothetical protein
MAQRTPKAEHVEPKLFIIEHIYPSGCEVVFRFYEYKRAVRKMAAIGKSNCIEFPFKWVHRDGVVRLRTVA